MIKFTESFKTVEEFKAVIGDISIKTQWVVGGVSGGSCWNDGANYSVGAEEEPDDVEIEEILELVAPTLTFLQFRKLMRAQPYTYTEFTQREYYGNRTEYRVRTLDLDVLYTALSDLLG